MAIDPNIKKKANDIRNKIYGKEVRESLASGLEAMSSDVIKNEGRQSVVESRQDSVESQWQSVIDETTNLDVVSAPEIIAARDGEANLKARLDKEKNEVIAKLAQTANVQVMSRNAKYPLTLPTYDGSGQSAHPSVIFTNTGVGGYKWFMAHTPYPNANDDFENPSILASNNGTKWIAFGTNPIDQPTALQIANGGYMSDTELIFKDGKLECYYRYNSATHEDKAEYLYRKIYDEVSETWGARELVLKLVGSEASAMSPSIIREDSVYKMWVCDTSGNIIYRESPTALDGTWSAPLTVPISYTQGTPSYKPWHISVFKDGDKYKLILNAILTSDGWERHILIGESTDGKTFTDTHLFMMPNKTMYSFDNYTLYRACVVKMEHGVEAGYYLYYSALGRDNKWNIGLISGTTLDSVRDIDYRNNSGNPLLPTVVEANTIMTSTYSKLNSEELSFFTPLVKSAKLKNTAPNTLSVMTETEELADLILKKLTATELSVLLKATISAVDPKLTLISPGKSSIVLGLMDPSIYGGFLRLGMEGSTDYGSLDTGCVKFNGGGVPIEGVIRYNSTTKKHQGHNGSTWNDLY